MQLKDKSKALFELEGFKHLTSVQNKVYPLFIDKKDLIVSSQTGTGKTHSFLLPIMDLINSDEQQLQALIITPTRELSQQIYQMASSMKEVDPNLRIDLIIGGTDREKMSKKLDVQPHLAIGTPGRILDMFSSGVLRCEQANHLVLDEADMIWEYGFLDDVIKIVSSLKDNIQISAFSATIPDQLGFFLKKVMTHPIKVTTSQQNEIQPNIDHIILDKKNLSYHDIVLDVLKHNQVSSMIVFANTREEASEIAENLSATGVDLLELHGDLSPRKRKQTLTRLSNDQHFILVASDIASRGLDLPYVSHVVSCGLPSHLEFYLHRAGRTGRVNREGTCYLIVSESDKQNVDKLSSLGVSFKYQRITKDGFKDVNNFFKKRVYHKKVDPEIQQILNRKNVVVKPNYKKKRKMAIAKLQQQKRRKMIQEEIQKQKKERAKARSKSED